jgi:hypothetical protein
VADVVDDEVVVDEVVVDEVVVDEVVVDEVAVRVLPLLDEVAPPAPLAAPPPVVPAAPFGDV